MNGKGGSDDPPFRSAIDLLVCSLRFAVFRAAGFADHDGLAVHVFAVETCDCSLGFLSARENYETEAFGRAARTITSDLGGLRRSKRLDELAKLRIGQVFWKITKMKWDSIVLPE